MLDSIDYRQHPDDALGRVPLDRLRVPAVPQQDDGHLARQSGPLQLDPPLDGRHEGSHVL